VQKAEEGSKAYKRSIYIAKNLAAGTILNEDHLKVIRPGIGMESRYLDLVIGRKLQVDVKAGMPLTWDLL
jgi:sialic acid synthase SpsE